MSKLIIFMAVLIVGLILWLFISGGPMPWLSKFTAQKYCGFKKLPVSQVVCEDAFKRMYPDECINGYRKLCHGRLDNGQCYETNEDGFDECMNNLVFYGKSKNFCNLIKDSAKRNSCLAR